MPDSGNKTMPSSFTHIRIHFVSDDATGFEGFAFDNFAVQSTAFYTPPATSQSSAAATSATSQPTSATSQPTSATSRPTFTSLPPVTLLSTALPTSVTHGSSVDNNIGQAATSSHISSGGIAAAVVVPIVVVAIIIGRTAHFCSWV